MKLDFTTLHRGGEDNMFHVTNAVTKEDVVIDEMFPMENWDCTEAFKMAGIRGYEPMTATELETEEQQDEKLRDSSYIIEEKFDGTRALVYFMSQQVWDSETNSLSDEYSGFCGVFRELITSQTRRSADNPVC